jgi:hypothetical protein
VAKSCPPTTIEGGGLKGLVQIVPGFSSLKLVVSPLQPRVVGPYPEGTRPYLDLLGRNWRPVVPGVQDPDNIN